MNCCIFIGNLTRDPQVKFTPNGTAVCEMGLAINEKFKEKEKTHFLDLVAWGRTAEVAGEYLVKGAQISVRCRVEQQTWQDRESGGNRSKIVFQVEDLKMLGGKRAEGAGGGNEGGSKKSNQQTSQPAEDFSGSGADDEVPF